MERLPSGSAAIRSRFDASVQAALVTAALSATFGPAEAGRAGDVSPVAILESASVEGAAGAYSQDRDAPARLEADRDRGGVNPDGGDHILMISTRGIGTRCDVAAMAGGLRCERRDANGRWRRLSWEETLADFAEPMPTVIYVHGNRISDEADKPHGLGLYRWLAARKTGAAPMRYVIWSWPATKIRGQIKDYEVKAARTRPCGWQLAWTIDRLPTSSPLAIVGYSYGARVTTGALHVLGGGRLGELELAERVHPERPPLSVALVAAAVDAQWLRPEGYHGRALGQTARLVLANNTLDPAMRFYPISPVGRHATALGYAGVPGRESLGELAARIHCVDMTAAVGRHHALSAYLSTATLGRALGQVVDLPAVMPDVSLASQGLWSTRSSEASEVAGRDSSGPRQ